MADETPVETPSSEAAEARKTIDELKAERDTLKSQVVNLGKVRHVERWVRAKGISDDATVDQWVDTIMPKANDLQFGDVAEIPSLLETSFGKLVQAPTVTTSTGDTTTTTSPPAEGVTPSAGTPADPAQAPGFAAPNPGTPGLAPEGPKKLAPNDPHLQELKRSNNWAELRRLNDEGQIDWTPPSERYGEKVPTT